MREGDGEWEEKGGERERRDGGKGEGEGRRGRDERKGKGKEVGEGEREEEWSEEGREKREGREGGRMQIKVLRPPYVYLTDVHEGIHHTHDQLQVLLMCDVYCYSVYSVYLSGIQYMYPLQLTLLQLMTLFPAQGKCIGTAQCPVHSITTSTDDKKITLPLL